MSNILTHLDTILKHIETIRSYGELNLSEKDAAVIQGKIKAAIKEIEEISTLMKEREKD